MKDIVREIEQKELLKAKIRRRVVANRIVALTLFRDHFSSTPGKNSWTSVESRFTTGPLKPLQNLNIWRR